MFGVLKRAYGKEILKSANNEVCNFVEKREKKTLHYLSNKQNKVLISPLPLRIKTAN